MDKKVAAILAVVIMVAAGCSLGYIIISNNDDKDVRLNTKEVAKVYGNANGDYTVDDLDVEILEKMVKGEITYTEKEYPFADANQDGAITQADVDIVNKILKKEKCEVYYLSYFNEALKLNYPVDTSRIAVTYWQQAEEAGILGLWNNVVVANKSVDGRDQLYDLSKVTFIGNSSGSALDSEQVQTILDKKVTLIIGSAYDSVRKFADPLAEQGVQTVYLWHAGEACISTLLTMGILCDCSEQAEKYLKFSLNIEEKLAEKAPAASERPTLVIVMNHGTDESRYISSYGGIFTSVNEPAGEWFLLQKLANVYTADVTGQKSQGRNFYSLDWFIQNPFDYMMVMGSGTGANTQAEFNTWFETVIDKYYKNTEEYANGNLLGTTFSFGGFAAYSLLPILAWMIYPDIFSYEEAVQLRQGYYDDFVPTKPDCTEIPMYYLGTNYKTSYIEA